MAPMALALATALCVGCRERRVEPSSRATNPSVEHDAIKTMGQMAFLALDHALGEYDVETKVGAIDLLPLDRAPKSAQPLADLPARIDEVFGKSGLGR
jgi:hypothetical protein